MNDDGTNREVELRPVIARLREIEKKCASMGSRNEEFPLMQERLSSIIKRLQEGEAASGGPLDYRAIARELFPVAHLFESVGFMSVGKEITHVERTLKALAPEAPTTDVAAAPESARRTPDGQPATVDRVSAPEETDDDRPDHRIPWPIAAGLVVLLATIVVSGMIVLEVGPFRAEPRVRATVPVVPVETAVTTAPSPTVVREPSRPTPGASNTLADEVAAARLALYYGDHEAAVDRLSAAALIDRDDTRVLEIARELVDRLVADAEGAVADARWEDAERFLERARRVAMRFGLETAAIDNTAKRHAGMERYVIVGPDDTQTIRSSAGKRVELRMANGSTRTGRIEGVAGADLLLEVKSNLGGGIVSYTDEVPLPSINSIKIFDN